MALLPRKGFLETLTPFIQCKRFRGKINVQKPKPHHFEKATYLALAKPWFINPKKGKTTVELCKFNEKFNQTQGEINPYNKIIAGELYDYFKSSKLVIFYHNNSINAEEQFKYYALFKKQNMDLKRYGKKILKLATTGTPYETVLDFYQTQTNYILFSPEPEISKVMKLTKKCPQLVLLAGIFEDKLLSKEDLDKYSKIPNLQAAQAELVQTVNSVGSKLVSDLNLHQNGLISNLENRIKQLQGEK